MLTIVIIQILQIDQDMRAEVSKDLADIRGKIAELVEKKVAAEDQLKRIDIRAPQSGYVHQLSVHTVGGVVGPGEQMMLIVPSVDVLNVEARIQRQDVDQVYVGQKAVLRFSSFSQRTTPELNGLVQQISADVRGSRKQEPTTIRCALASLRMNSSDWVTSSSFQACLSRPLCKRRRGRYSLFLPSRSAIRLRLRFGRNSDSIFRTDQKSQNQRISLGLGRP
jgi:HlyD family secretion protein